MTRLTCQECNHRWSVRPAAYDPECPKCGGVDWDLSEFDSAPPLNPEPGDPGYQPTCPPEAREVEGIIFDRPATLFIRESDGHCMGYRRGSSTPHRWDGVLQPGAADADTGAHPDYAPLTRERLAR